MALKKSKINEQAMHEDIRILIKVCAPLTSFFSISLLILDGLYSWTSSLVLSS